jgi:hypothetical protein
MWAREEVGWELSKLKFRRHLTDRGFTAAKGTGGVRLITGLRLKSTRPASTLIGTLDDGRLVYDTEISDLPEDGGKSCRLPRSGGSGGCWAILQNFST